MTSLHYPLQLWSSPTWVWKHRELAWFLSRLYPAVPVSPLTLARALPFPVSVSLSVEKGCLYQEPDTARLAQYPAYGKVFIKVSTKDNLVEGACLGTGPGIHTACHWSQALPAFATLD